MPFGFIRDGVRRIFRLEPRFSGRSRAEAEDELRAFIAARVDHLVARGWTPNAAHDEAIRRLGGSFDQALTNTIRSAQHREDTLSFRDFIADLRDDLRFAVRGLRRERHVTTFIVLTLALGIGANAAMFGVADRLLIRGPDHVVDPDRLMRVYRTVQRPEQGEVTNSGFGYVSYDIFRRHVNSASFAAYNVSPVGIPFGSGTDALQVPYGTATHDLFTVLGVQPRVGRFYNAQEDSPTAPQRVAVLGYGLWTRAFGQDPNIVGRQVRFGNDNYTVVGVAPRGFNGPQLAPVDVWLPMSWRSRNVTENWPAAWNAQWMRLVARVKPGATPEQAGAEMTATYRAAYAGDDTPQKTAVIGLGSLASNAQGKESLEATIARWLVGVAAIVLLIACANAANLLLARAVRRRREVAVRVALGAGRGRLVRLLLSESALLAALGAAAGLVVAWFTAGLLRRTLLADVDWTTAPVDARVLAVSLLTAVVVALLTGLAPALRASRPDLTAALKSGEREGGSGGGHASRLRNLLTVSQAALSIVLLVGAGLFVRSLANVNAVDLGIQPSRILVTRVSYWTDASPFNKQTEGEARRRLALLTDLMHWARRQPSIENASISIGLPFQSAFGQSQRIAGYDSIPYLNGNAPLIAAVANGYFETVGTRLLAGRGFTEGDREGSEPVAIVNHSMATTLWPGRSPIGDCLYWGTSRDSLTVCSRIVGVVADQHNYRLKETAGFNYYIPFGQQRGFGGASLLIRPREGMEAAATAAIRKHIVESDAGVRFVQVRSLQLEVDPQMRPYRMGATIFTLMGVLALVVAAMGLYSVLSYLVAQRTREIGVRIALGAQPRRIVGLVMRSSVGMTAAGIGLGGGIALLAGNRLAPLLFDVSPRDPLVFGAVSLTLLAVAVAASVVPAARARRVDPMEALRAD